MKKENDCEIDYDSLIKALEPLEVICLRQFDDADSPDCVGKIDKCFEKNNMQCIKYKYDNIYNDFYCSPKIPIDVKMIAQKAVIFAKKYQMNAEIVCLDAVLYVTIRVEHHIFISDELNDLVELYRLSDYVYCTTEKGKPHEIIIRLAYNMDNCTV